jgi:iron complex transport system ATP-binding protein
MIFEVRNGSFGYRREDQVLRNISFSVTPGEIVAVLGPNGAGKTTLLKNMMGLLTWQKGESLIDGKPLSEIPHRERWRQIAYVPQARNSAFSFTVLEMVVMGRCAHIGVFGKPSQSDYHFASQALSDVDMQSFAHKQCGEISGGELQMVLIARALATQPKMLVLDEPESNLDFKNQLIILDTIERLSCDKNISCVFNTHYPSHALKVASKALLIDKQGRCIFDTTADVVNAENLCAAFGVNVAINNLTIADREYSQVLAISIA